MKNEFYSLKNILERGALYNLIIGERSNGKTFAVLEYALKRYFAHGEKLAVIRRYREDLRGKRGAELFASLISDAKGVNHIEKISSGKWDGVRYYSGRWYFTKTTEDDKIIAENPFAFSFALTETEHDKGAGFPDIGTIFFDEFLTRERYLDNEFVLLMNTISTIVRNKAQAKIFMCANTVNKYAPYFNEMGLTHVEKMNRGDIDLYTYGDTDLTVAVEYCDNGHKSPKKSDVYFAFDNPRLKMITSGEWEIALYPHLPEKYKPKDIILTYFIKFDGHILQAEIVILKSRHFTYVHNKTTPIQDEDKDIIYSLEYDPRPNWRRSLFDIRNRRDQIIADYYRHDLVYYQSNEVGEIVRNFINNTKGSYKK